jgi:hypothetical protein
MIRYANIRVGRITATGSQLQSLCSALFNHHGLRYGYLTLSMDDVLTTCFELTLCGKSRVKADQYTAICSFVDGYFTALGYTADIIRCDRTGLVPVAA